MSKKERMVISTIRLQRELLETIKELAKREGLPYQTYLRSVLTRAVRKKQTGKRLMESKNELGSIQG